MSVIEAPALEFGYVDPITGERCGPQPKQQLAHESPAQWLFYGGQVGGGKSEYLIVEAVQTCLEHRGVDVAIFRRKLKDLEQSLIPRFHELVPRSLATLNSTLKKATFSTGSVLWFCYCNNEADVYQYQSAQWAMLGIDEASHFTQFQFMYLQTRVRSPKLDESQLKVRLGSNPGGPGHGWLKRMFVRPAPLETGGRLIRPYEVWRPLPPPDMPVKPEDMKTRVFIPASFDDNEALKRKNPGYLASVYMLGGDKARQLAEGDWDANEGMIVGGIWRERVRVSATDEILLQQGLREGLVIPWHVLDDPSWRPPAGALLFGSSDYGFGVPWSFHLTAVLAGGHTRTFFEFYKTRVRDVDQVRLIREVLAEREYQLEWLVLDPATKGSREETGLAKSIFEVYQDGLPGTHVRLGAGGRAARLSRPNRWLDALATAPDGFPWWSCTTACPHLIRTVPEVPWDEDDPDVEDGDSENHAYEDLGRFFEARPHQPRVQPIDPLAHLTGDPVSHAHQTARAKREGRMKQPRRSGLGGFSRGI